MGLDLSFEAGADRFDIRFSDTDWEILSLLATSEPAAFESFAGVEDFGEPRSGSRSALLAAVDALVGALEREKERLPYVYGYTVVEGQYAGMSGSGSVSGIRINSDGHFYALSGGLGECVLTKRAVGPDGKGVVVERRDIRGLSSLQTDNFGTIKIWRKKKNTTLARLMADLKRFLLRVDADQVTKTLG